MKLLTKQSVKINLFLFLLATLFHWCHIMKKESFDDIEIATFLIKYFVTIKADHEIHSDIDNTYMNVSQLLNRSYG